ncbi:hypothetical protein [Pantoea sp. X85]|uniref:hypothetical protein n=1 Tax=Pantoea sp. X85 TaxID=3037258 RepID=UPI0024133E08|nr:hypothetical protein [Pantoea sp. X85]WFL66420.1 hypothetical protein P6287_13695 [Pantoea sp. X85]
MMTEEQLIDRICLTCVDVRHAATDESAQKFINDIRGLAEQLAALTQPASPALKLPDGWVAVPNEPTEDMIAAGSAVDGGVYSIWKDMIYASPDAPHTAPIEPICATSGAEWVSSDRLSQLSALETMREVSSMAKELLALRKAFTQPIVWIHQTTGAKLNNSVIEDARKQSGVWVPLYRKPTDSTT